MLTPGRSGTDLANLRALAASVPAGVPGIVLPRNFRKIPTIQSNPIYSIDREPSIEGRRALYHGPCSKGTPGAVANRMWQRIWEAKRWMPFTWARR